MNISSCQTAAKGTRFARGDVSLPSARLRQQKATWVFGNLHTCQEALGAGASLAQLAEHALRKRMVMGSIPIGGLMSPLPFRRRTQNDRVPTRVQGGSRPTFRIHRVIALHAGIGLPPMWAQAAPDVSCVPDVCDARVNACGRRQWFHNELRFTPPWRRAQTGGRHCFKHTASAMHVHMCWPATFQLCLPHAPKRFACFARTATTRAAGMPHNRRSASAEHAATPSSRECTWCRRSFNESSCISRESNPGHIDGTDVFYN